MDFDLLVKKQSVKRSKFVKWGLRGGGGRVPEPYKNRVSRGLGCIFLKKIQQNLVNRLTC